MFADVQVSMKEQARQEIRIVVLYLRRCAEIEVPPGFESRAGAAAETDPHLFVIGKRNVLECIKEPAGGVAIKTAKH